MCIILFCDSYPTHYSNICGCKYGKSLCLRFFREKPSEQRPLNSLSQQPGFSPGFLRKKKLYCYCANYHGDMLGISKILMSKLGSSKTLFRDTYYLNFRPLSHMK